MCEFGGREEVRKAATRMATADQSAAGEVGVRCEVWMEKGGRYEL